MLVINGTPNSDNLLGAVGDDTINGLGGNDTITGSTGSDQIDGGIGFDFYQADYSSRTSGLTMTYDSVTGNGTIVVGTETATLISIESFRGSNGIFGFKGTAFADRIIGSPDDENSFLGFGLNGGDGDDTILAGDGYDLLLGEGGNDSLEGEAGEDSLFGGIGNDILNGGSENDILEGGSGDDTCNGGADNDFIRSDAGSDVINGGSGIDIYLADYSAASSGINMSYDSVTGNGTIHAGGETDQLISIEAFGPEFRGSAFDDRMRGVPTLPSFFEFPHLYGGAGNDTLVGTASYDYLYGEDGDDSLNGGGRTDLLYGGAGSNTIHGGSGNDFYLADFTNATSSMTMTYDALTGNGTITAGGQTDVLISIEGYLDNFNGTGFADQIQVITKIGTLPTFFQGSVYGYAGDDTITGGTANDFLNGDDGNDILNGDAGSDYLDGGQENDILNGEAGGDTLSGWSGDDTLLGGADNDSLDGSTGNDSLDGGTGNDYLNGGTGDDTLNGDDDNDIFFSNSGNDVINGGSGIDIYVGTYSSATSGLTMTYDSLTGSGTITAGAESDGFTSIEGIGGLYGTNFADQMIGVSPNSVAVNGILGGAGDDTITGSAGDDYFDGEDGNDLLDGNSGNDFLVGREGLDTLNGGAGDDNLFGFEDDDSLSGGADDDRLIGGPGSDSMDGGSGDDTYLVENTGDVVTEAAGEGEDRVRSTIGYALGADVENLVLDGANSINGIGNALDNRLIGNAGNNRLIGGAGDDTLRGVAAGTFGVGEVDTLIGGAGEDIFILGSAAGRLYDDLLPGSGGTDYALVSGFAPGQDRLFLHGNASEYLLGASPIPGVSGTGVFDDSDASGSLDASDELIAIVSSAGALTVANTLTPARYV